MSESPVDTSGGTSSPSPSRRRRRPVLLVAVCLIGVLALTADDLWYEALRWSPIDYVFSCQRPLADLCVQCPTIMDKRSTAREPRSCGLGIWSVVATPGFDDYQAQYFDRSGRLVAAFRVGDLNSACSRLGVWYGQLVWCRVTP
jgi:hypothetical protein